MGNEVSSNVSPEGPEKPENINKTTEDAVNESERPSLPKVTPKATDSLPDFRKPPPVVLPLPRGAIARHASEYSVYREYLQEATGGHREGQPPHKSFPGRPMSPWVSPDPPNNRRCRRPRRILIPGDNWPRNRPKRPPTSPPELALSLRGRNQHVSRFGYNPPAYPAERRERRVCLLLSAPARSRVLVTGADSGRSSITIWKTGRVPLRPAYGNCLAMVRVAGRRTTIDPHRLPWLRDGFLSGRGPTALRRRPPMTTSHPPGVAVVQWAYSQGQYQWFIKRRRAEREERVEFRVGVPYIKRPFLMVRLWEFNSQDKHPSELFALATERGADLQAMRRIIDAHLPERKCG